MKLSVVERLVLLELLPKEGSFANLKLLRIARESLSFDEEENKALNIHQEGDRVIWNNNVNIIKDVTIGEVATQMIVKELEKLDKEENLKEEHLSLFEKFCS